MDRFATLISFGLAAFAFLAACNTGPEKVKMSPEKRSQRGESCLARNDCSGDLACVNNTCVRNEFEIASTANHCKVIQCKSKSDCCGEPPEQCSQLDEDCQNGDQFACQQYEDICRCNQKCQDNRCVLEESSCESNAECVTQMCVNGTCVECQSADDCSGDQICKEGRCEPGCNVDENCPLFHSCKNGRCQETGCKSDRECVLFTENGSAVCSDGECSVPCNSDAECNKNSSNAFNVCENGRCKFVGCETDAECRAAEKTANTSGSEQVVCVKDNGSSN